MSPRLSEAFQYAAELHKTQLRKGTRVPYIAHLMSVAGIVLHYGGTEDEAIAALLHDAVEDQGGAATRAEIERRFGAAVAAIVDGCTDSDTVPKPPWRERKEAYLAHLAEASPSVRLVSAADKLDNARSLLRGYRIFGEGLWGRFNGGREGTLWYYRSLAAAFRAAGDGPLVEELDRVVSEMERLAGATASWAGSSEFGRR